MAVKKNSKLFIILLMIISCCGCDSSNYNGTYYNECCYNDNGEEICIKKYIPPKSDENPYLKLKANFLLALVNYFFKNSFI